MENVNSIREQELLAKYNELIIPLIELNEKCKENKKYRGIQILFSKLSYNPKILFIGINPGNGYYKCNNKPVYRINPTTYSEHLGTYSKWTLATNLKKLMEEIGNQLNETISYGEQIMFMNTFPIATDNEADLHSLLSDVKKHNLDYQVYRSCFEFIRNIISIIKPQIIVCIGKSAFDNLCKETKSSVICNNGNVLSATLEFENIPVIGIKRRLSGFRGDIKNEIVPAIISRL